MKAMVRWKDLATGIWQQPTPVLARVRVAVCVFPTDAERPVWLPERCVRPVDVPADTEDHEDDLDSTNIGTGAMDVAIHGSAGELILVSIFVPICCRKKFPLMMADQGTS
ncbi:hypothetical protein STEG23_014750, partial [Scotinomys teguina]